MRKHSEIKKEVFDLLNQVILACMDVEYPEKPDKELTSEEREELEIAYLLTNIQNTCIGLVDEADYENIFASSDDYADSYEPF